ncbi:MAG: DUF5677 domain-containing protein [Burkholderiaceae bacterium]|nr:DUF5677 domain-containing protein [Burkholderiaceae bacterium]
MSKADDGFLTEPLDHVREGVRQKYADWRSLLLRVNRLAVDNQHSIQIHLDSNVEKYAAALFARTLATTQASILLLEVGLVPQARTLLRAALETHFALAAIAKEPGVVDKLIEGHAAEQKRVAKNFGHLQHTELKQIADAEAASDRLQPFLASSATALSTLDLAKKAGLEHWYRTVYTDLSWSAHGAAVDLERHVVVGEDGDVAEFRNEPEVEGQESSWLCAIEILLKATTTLAEVFPNVDKSPLEQQYAELRTLAEKFQTNPALQGTPHQVKVCHE